MPSLPKEIDKGLPDICTAELLFEHKFSWIKNLGVVFVLRFFMINIFFIRLELYQGELLR
jgi:hypothetical protein